MTQAVAVNADDLANKIADHLFTNGNGDTAKRLVLELEAGARNL